MKKLTLASITLLGISASVCFSCSSNKNNAASTTETAGQGTGATSGSSSQAGGGAGGAGGASADGVPITNGYLTQGSLMGSVTSSTDGVGSTMTLASGHMCASGNVIQIPLTDAGPDYNAWGAGFVWFLNQDQLADGGLGDANVADLSSFTRIVVGISGAAGLTLRLQLGLPFGADGGIHHPEYCTSLPTTGTGDAGIALSSLTESCWLPGGAAFDPATVRPLWVMVVVLTDLYAAYPFNFCVTRLEFLP
jgi:hypothetical protein